MRCWFRRNGVGLDSSVNKEAITELKRQMGEKWKLKFMLS